MALQESKLRFILILLLPVFFAAAILILTRFHLVDCIWKTLTGHECPGCGMTRAFYSLIHGDFHSAYEYNHSIIIVAPLMIYIWIKMLLQNTTNK